MSIRTRLPACFFSLIQCCPTKICRIGRKIRRILSTRIARSVSPTTQPIRAGCIVLAGSGTRIGGIAPTYSAIIVIRSVVHGATAGISRFVASQAEAAAIGVGSAGLPAGGFGVGLIGAAEFVRVNWRDVH